MANRRMFSKKITDTDLFLDLPLSSQCLYFHLNMHADDDGFLGNAKTVRRMIGASEDDLKLLLAKELLIPFDNGVVVIKDWKIHNYIRKDTYRKTIYNEEKQQLTEDYNGAYTFRPRAVHETLTQDRIGKDRIGKDRIDNNNERNNVTNGRNNVQKCYTEIEIEKEIEIDKEKEVSSANAQDHPPFKEIIDYLNQKTNSNYRYTTGKTKELIKARYNEGFGLEDFKKVIDIKTAEWLNDNKMKQYLRPTTLFGTKFESYLNQKQQNDMQWLDDLM